MNTKIKVLTFSFRAQSDVSQHSEMGLVNYLNFALENQLNEIHQSGGRIIDIQSSEIKIGFEPSLNIANDLYDTPDDIYVMTQEHRIVAEVPDKKSLS